MAQPYVLTVLKSLLDRGYIVSKEIPITQDIDTVIENGFYTWAFGDTPKKPAGGGSYFVRVQKIVETYILQEVVMGWGAGKAYTRVMDNGVWGPWDSDDDKITALRNDTVNRKNGDALGYSDGRSLAGDDLKPKYYVTARNKNGLCIQLITGVQIGLPDYALVTLVTFLPWSDTSGGVKQLAYPKGLNTNYSRYALGDDAWDKWEEVAMRVELPLTIEPGTGASAIFLTPKVVITNGNTWAVSGGLKLTKPLADGTVVLRFPAGIIPKAPYHIFLKSWDYDIPHYCRFWCESDGSIKIYGASQLQMQSQTVDLDFSRTVTF